MVAESGGVVVSAGSAGVVVPEGVPPTDESLLAGWSVGGGDRFGPACESVGLLLVPVVPFCGAASVVDGGGDELVAESEGGLAGGGPELVVVESVAVDDDPAVESGVVPAADVVVGLVAVGSAGVGEVDVDADVSLGGTMGSAGVPAVPMGSLGGIAGMFDGMVRLMPSSVVVSGVP